MTHDELRSIALEIGWIYKTAHRRAYHVKNILEASGLLTEIKHGYQRNSMSIVTSRLLSLLENKPQTTQQDLDELVRKISQEHLLSTGIEVDWEKPLMECIEILEGAGMIHRRGNNLTYDSLRHKKLQEDLCTTTIIHE